MNRRLLDYNPEGQGAEGEVLLFGTQPYQPARVPGEIHELDFASEFLDASAPGSIVALVSRMLRYASANGRPLDPRLARELALRLTRTGSWIGTSLRAREAGAGSNESSETAERIFGTELEGLSAEDQEFETARYFVRFALAAARAAASVPVNRAPALAAATAERIAARRYAPGLVSSRNPTHPGFRSRRAARRNFV